MSFPFINRHQTLRQLELLGYQQSENLYLRFFYPANDPRKEEDKGRKADHLNFQEIEAHQRQGRGAYFVINGGGHKNDDVQSGRAIFYEHDNLDKDLQRELWKTLGLPEPTFQIDTGGKSIHSYWVFNQPIPVDKWCELQRDLLEFADGDRSIKNPARVMRLAGAWHISIDKNGQPVYNQTHLISESGQTYSYEELRSAIPESVPSPSSGNHQSAQGEFTDSKQFPHHPAQISIPVPVAVPLYFCLAKADRHLLDNGAAQGGRNSGGAKLARDLIGTYNYLRELGQSVDGDPRQLLEDYASRCTPPLPVSEVESIWKSAEQSHPTPSCGSEGVENCLRGWYWKTIQNERNFNPKSNPPRPQGGIPNPKFKGVTGDSSILSDTLIAGQLSFSATVTAVTTILKAGLKDYAERAELDAIEIRSVISKAAFWEMVKTIRCDLDEVQPSDTQRTQQLIDWHNATLDFKQILPKALAEAFDHDAAILNIDPISLWQYFFPAVLSIAGKRVNLDVESHTIPALAWTCIVGESGTGKTRAEKLILAPLKDRQIEERKRWEAEMREYQLLLKQKDKDGLEPPQPRPERKYIFEVATIQALMKRLSEQGENGSIWARDELAGLFKSLGQFSSNKGGESEGLECLLKMWDGGAAFVERMDELNNSYVADQTRLSIAGGIQPGAFRQAFKDQDDPQGLQARFLYAVPKVKSAKRVKGYCILSEILPALYDWLDRLPVGSIKLSREADVRYSQLVEQIGAEAEKSPNPAIRAWMRKLPTQLLRIALGNHLVECFFDPQRNFWQLQPDTLERAVEVCRYYRSAFQVVQEKAADSDSISSILLKIWDLAVTHPDGLTPRDVYRHVKALGRRATELGRQVGAYTLELLSKLVEIGKGKLEKDGRFYRFFAIFNPSSANPPDSPQNPEHPPTPDSQKNPEHPPTPGGNGSGGRNSVEINEIKFRFARVAEGIRNKSEGNSTNGVTVVTAAQIETGQELEASLPTVVSPVTEENANYSESLTWLLQFLADLESTPPSTRFTSCEQLDKLLDECEINFRVVQKAQGCLDVLQQVCPDYLERMFVSLGLRDEALSKVQASEVEEAMPTPIVELSSIEQPSVVQSSVAQSNEASLSPTLAELQALLLACQSLTELKSLKKQHPDKIKSAYQQLSSSQQLKVDGISATAVPGEVYKYTGPTLFQDGQKLATGVLVYIDPNAKFRKSLSLVPVWLIRGLELGWHTAMSVSRDCLLLVEKAVNDVVVDFNIEQPPLFDIF